MKRLMHVAMGLGLLAIGCGSLTSSPAPAPVNSALSTQSANPDASSIKVEARAIIYLPDQQGGSFHNVFVLVKNNSSQVAIGVTGQISISKNGSLIRSVNPTKVNLLPGAEGLWNESADLGQPVPDATLEAIVSVDGGFRAGPSQSPVTFDKVTYHKDPLSGCEISGVVKNTFTQVKDNLQIRVVGLNGNNIVTGGVTYVDKVFPGQDATWSVREFSPAACPGAVERILVLPNLGADKIFNP